MADADDTTEDREHEPSTEPSKSRVWLNLIVEAEKAFETYQEKADNIDKVYASLEKLAGVRDREFQMFWANIEVLKPSIYSRPPVPVVVPRFKDRRPVPRAASELLERSAIVAFDLTDIDGVMIQIRDDVVVSARGVPWVRYETKQESDGETERACVEHLDRRDFLHGLARKWSEVPWVARRAWLSKREMRERFSKDKAEGAAYEVRRDDRDRGGVSRQEKAGVWEIWHKTENKVVWVTEGVEDVLDEGKPHLKLSGFFPCPRPAYGTTQRRTLIPVPDMLFYKDQLEEINELTGRISALTGAVKVRGFYPAGSGEIGDAIEAALKKLDDRAVMVGVSNWAAFGGGSAKDTIVWLPIDMIVTTIAALVEQRRQIIDDVYQITGLSDIMRGATDPKETLGAQQLKSQYGSIRIRDRQAELVRVARDCGRIVCEIMAENFSQQTLMDMAQMELPTAADIKRQMADLEKQAKQVQAAAEKQMADAEANPQFQQMKAQDPEQAEQIVQQAQQQVEEQLGGLQAQAGKLKDTVTIDAVMDLLRGQNIRPFVLDIETDSTIQPDEDAEKQRRTEFVTTLGSLLQQVAPMVQAQPDTAEFAGEIIKFALAPFRVGRELEGAVDEFVDRMKSKAGQPQPNPEAEAAKAQQAIEQQKLQAEQQMDVMRLQHETQQSERDHQARMAEIQVKAIGEQQRAEDERLKAEDERVARREEAGLNLRMIQAQIERDDRKGALEERRLQMEIEAKQLDGAIRIQDAAIDAESAEQNAEHNDRAFEQQSALAERKAEAQVARPG